MAADRDTPAGTESTAGNDYMDDVRAEIAALWNVVGDRLTGVSGTNDILGSAATTLGAYADGQEFIFTAANTNTGAMRVNVDSIGYEDIVDWTGAAISAGKVEAGKTYRIKRLGGAWYLSPLDAASGVGNFSVVDRQVFNASDTWSKPVACIDSAIVIVEAIGAGGGGALSNSENAFGGEGGPYVREAYLGSELGASETVTIGAGGAGKSSSNGDGSAGGATSFGSHVSVPSGRGGGRTSSGDTATVTPTITVSTQLGPALSVYEVSGVPKSLDDLIDNSAFYGDGWIAHRCGGYGGQGGGGTQSPLGTSKQSSIHAGDGGKGAWSSGTANSGTAPGGGGGGAVSSPGGDGADGRIVVTVLAPASAYTGPYGDAGAIALPYVFDSATADADPGAGKLRLDNATQSSATAIRIDELDSNGDDQSAIIDSLDDADSAIKGHVRLYKRADPSQYILGTVSAVDSSTGYRNVTISVVAYSGTTPFADGDNLILAFVRTGDKGSTAAATVRAAATSNLAISTDLQNGDTVDGVTLATGDLVLLAGQTAASENGIYQVVASGAAARATGFTTYDDHPGLVVSVQEGTAEAATLWLCTSALGGTLETTDIDFARLPVLDHANTWTAVQTINAGASVPMELEFDDDSATGVYVTVFKDSASPANFDALGGLVAYGRDSNGDKQIYGNFQIYIGAATAGAHTGVLSINTRVGGSAGNRMQVGDGAIVGSPTGSFKGDGTLNATAVYDDNVLLTDIVREAVETGGVDTDKWDATVPDIEVPELTEIVPVLQDMETDVPVVIVKADGSRAVRMARKTVSRPAVETLPLVDARGRRIGVARRQITEEQHHPARTISRRHAAAHLLKEMMDAGFRPGDYRSVRDWYRGNGTLPGLPSAAEWEHNKFSLGEMVTRANMAKEIICEAMCHLADRFDEIEARLTALENTPSPKGRK